MTVVFTSARRADTANVEFGRGVLRLEPDQRHQVLHAADVVHTGTDQDVARYRRDGSARLLQVFVDLLRGDRDDLEPGTRIVSDGKRGNDLQGDGGPQEQ